jgi:Ca2+-binding RTX toxin-like protein
VLTAIDCDDRIIGSAGDNTIAGGGGNDTIDYSGLGKAIIAFRGVVIDKGGLGTDRITNFLNIVGATGFTADRSSPPNSCSNKSQIWGSQNSDLPSTRYW